MTRSTFFLVTVLLGCACFAGQPPTINVNGGKLVYIADERGNRVPDFSTCGYMAAEKQIPDVPVRIVVPPVAGDNTARIQAAIDHVASLPPDQRGAVLLERGRYEVFGGLKITASGVVLRGSGQQTVLVAAGQDRRPLITIAGAGDRKVEPEIAIAEPYVPVNSLRLRLTGPHNLKVGDSILIRRPCTAEWIRAIGMANLGGERHGFSWRPGSRQLLWDRTITAVEGDTITIDSPITTAIDADFGGGTVSSYVWPGRISNVGVENLRCESSFDPADPADEDHAWFAVTMENVSDAWVRQVTFAHFAGGAVAVWESCKRITVEDCRSLEPISQIGGWRRHTFFTAGQQTLFQRCYSERGRHDFSVGYCAAGPNAFVQCQAVDALDDSGPIDSWASGVLYDNVRIEGNALSLHDRRYDAAGAGWAAANSVLWQCQAAIINCFSPPMANNWAFACWATFNGDGVWQYSNDSVSPQSLYWAQLAERIGPQVMQRADLLELGSEPSSSPTPAQAAALIAASTQPAMRLDQWIDAAARRRPIPIDPAGAKRVDEVYRPADSGLTGTAKRLSIHNGWLTCSGVLMVGRRLECPWWRGSIRPEAAAQAPAALTRFVPGRSGRGFTDDLRQLAADMLSGGIVAFEQHPPLWYDRRRDDHQRVRRMTGDVWPPFYEWPFARSGQGVAWDGLSKYDLTRYNPWYFSRLRQFADLCDQNGLVLIHQMYFQHSVLEAGAHWADFPWRSANNINNTGFPEPPPYAGDKRIFMAEQFYDVTHPVRRELHRAYIRKCLENFAANSNVIQLTSDEYTGPLHFVQFWLDVIAEWQRDTGNKAIVGLSATRDVQDAILADPQRAALVSVIDIRYWWYQSDGSLYAPQGGLNLAPRQHERVLKPKPASFEQVARAVREYREKYPDKAVVYSVQTQQDLGLAALLGGASLANVRLDERLLEEIPKMRPLDLPGQPPGVIALGVPDEQYLLYSPSGPPKALDGFTSQSVGPNLFWLKAKPEARNPNDESVTKPK